MKYCVYLHVRKDNESVYYIGSGVTSKRPTHFSGRSKEWVRIHNIAGTSVIIFKDNLTIKEARILEEELILSKEYPDIINKNLPLKIVDNEILLELSKYVRYSTTSKTSLVWTRKVGSRSNIDKEAGCLIFKNGLPRSSCIQINKIMVKIPRLIWIMFGNIIPEDHVIDHIDNNPHNNSIENLRCVSMAINGRNKYVKDKLNGLPCGFYLNKGSIVTNVIVDGITNSKSWSINKYGYDEALSKAMSWRNRALSLLNDKGCGYTNNHFSSCNLHDFNHKSSSSTGYSNVWLNKSKGVISSGLGRINRKYFNTNKLGYDEALKLALEYLETLSNT